MNDIVISNLNYSYYNRVKNTSTKALTNVNLTFGRGMRIVVCGKNGAGKSTLLSIIAGKKLIREEEVLVFNKPVFHDTTLAGRIGFVGEWWSNDYAMNIKIKELFSEYRGSRRYTHLLKMFDMDENKLISGISKGEKKKVQIMVNIIKRKDIYIFDEATESLDLISRKLLLEFLRKESEKHNCIIIYSTHIFDYIQGWCSHILYLSNGSVAFFSDIGSVTSAKNYVSLADHIFENMMRETREKEKEKGLTLDDLLRTDSE
ncbi:CCR4-associated factor 16, putative [Plasmodium ovale]|uniref:CCR4-associated factor 16, putative n=1 Tax=Plasmodium ovale TaxID=36330 RepID=A0A1C3KX12_PLAOA|nr:CCR4-associated factor 16, putative [Plasmodium ovale]